MIGAFLTEMLSDLSHDVCATVATEEDAVTAAAQYQPSLIIVDGQLREGTGASAVTRILRGAPVQFILMSGAPARRASRVVLQKPFAEADLVRALGLMAGGVAAPVLRPTGNQGD